MIEFEEGNEKGNEEGNEEGLPEQTMSAEDVISFVELAIKRNNLLNDLINEGENPNKIRIINPFLGHAFSRGTLVASAISIDEGDVLTPPDKRIVISASDPAALRGDALCAKFVSARIENGRVIITILEGEGEKEINPAVFALLEIYRFEKENIPRIPLNSSSFSELRLLEGEKNILLSYLRTITQKKPDKYIFSSGIP